MLSLKQIDEIITEFKEKNDNEYENIDKIILPQSKTDLNKVCQEWNNIDEKYYNDANLDSKLFKNQKKNNICQLFPSENSEDDTQQLKCFTRGNILSNCDNRIPYFYEIPFINNDKVNIIKTHMDNYNKNTNIMNSINEKFINLINKIQEIKNKLTDSSLLNKNNKTLKSIINRTDDNKSDELDQKNKEIMIEKSKLDELSEQNNNMEIYIRRLSSIAKFIFVFMILIMMLSSVIKLNLTASLALVLLIIGLLALMYLLIFKKKSYFSKIIPTIKD